jgi:hypothetical protein
MDHTNDDNNTKTMENFKNWIHLRNKFYYMKNNIIDISNDINFFSENTTLNSSLKDYECQNQDAIKFFTTFFHHGIIQKYTIDKNILRVKFQLNHDHIMYINLEVSFLNNLIHSVNMSDGFNDRFY